MDHHHPSSNFDDDQHNHHPQQQHHHAAAAADSQPADFVTVELLPPPIVELTSADVEAPTIAIVVIV